MKKQLSLFAITIVALFGCTTNDSDTIDFNPSTNGKTPITIQASNGQETRAILGEAADGKVPVYWENDDRIALYRTSNWSDKSSTVRDLLAFTDWGEDKSMAQFGGYITVAPNKEGDLWVALYSPELKEYVLSDDTYSDNHSLYNVYGTNQLTDISIPDVQDGTWDGIMVATKQTSSGSEQLAFTFTSLMPVIELKMTNDGEEALTVSKVEYSNVQGAEMTGSIAVMSKPYFVPDYDSANRIQTVTVDKSITIAAGADATIHITVPPTANPIFSSVPEYAEDGFALKITLSNGTTVTKAYPKYVDKATYYTTSVNLSADADMTDVINVIVPGSLPTLLKYKGYSSANKPTKLTISGTLNDKDFSVGLYQYGSSIKELDLKNATIPNNQTFNAFANMEKIVLPDNFTVIPEFSFPNCKKLQTVSGAGVDTVGMSAFIGCTALENISFPKATTIGEAAFQNCDALEDISFPEATTIGTDAFYRCRALENISFPNATTIGTDAFHGCITLTTAKFGAKIDSFETRAFGDMDTEKCDLYLNSAEMPSSGDVWRGYTWKSINLYK